MIRTARWPLWAASLLAVTLGLMVIAISSPTLWRAGLSTDVDTQMRMAFLEWAGSRGTPEAYLFPRDGAPGGMLLHWTLPYDLFALAVAAPMAAFEGWHAAIGHAALLTGPLCYLLECAAVAALAKACGFGRAAPWAVSVMAIAPSLTGYTGIGRMTHHGLTAALGTMALAASVSLCRRARPRDGVLAAAWTVLAAWESIEMVPALLVAWAVVVSGASLRRTRDRAFLAYAMALPAFALAVLVADPDPLGVLAPSVDRFGLYHVVMFATFAVGIGLAIRARGQGRPMARLARGFAAAAPLLLGVLWLGFHLIPSSLSTDLIMNVYMHSSETELKPAWADANHFVNAVRPGVFVVLVALLGLFRRLRRPQAVVWLLALALLGFEFGVGIRFARLAPYGAAVGAVLLGATLRATAARLLRDCSGNRATTGFSLVCLVLVTVMAPSAVSAVHLMAAGERDLTGTCDIGPRMAASIEAALPKDAIVASDLWFSPELLERTHLRTVAGPFHRNVSGIHDVAMIFAGDGDFYPRMIATVRGASALLACTLPIRARDPIYDDASLERRLAVGDVPPWLKRVPGVGDGRFGLYLVTPFKMRGAPIKPMGAGSVASIPPPSAPR